MFYWLFYCGVGYVANSLFGVLDERFAVQYEKDITAIRNNQKHLISLYKNQTSIIEGENNLLRRVETSIEQEYIIFKEHLTILEKATNDIKNELQQIEIVNEFILSSIIANNILISLKNIQDSLLDTITNSQTFNLHLLAPEQLRSELSIISGQLTKDISLPIANIQTDLQSIYKVLKVKARMTAQYYIFELQIPLVSRDNYDLYRVYSVPRQVEDAIVSIEPIADYLAINLQKDTYLPLSEKELQKCTEMYSKASHLCELQKPVYSRVTDESFCIRDDRNKHCRTTTSTCQVSWTELFTINTFMLSCCKQCNLRVICGDQITSETLTGVYIIALGSGCLVKSEQSTITSHKQHTNELSIEPDIVLAEIAPVNRIINITIPAYIASQNDSFPQFEKSFEAVDKEITQIKAAEEQEEQEQEMSSHDYHHYIAIYTVAIVVLACVAFIWWRSRRSASVSILPASSADIELATMAGIQLTPGASNATAASVDLSRCDSARNRSKVQISVSDKHEVNTVSKGTSPSFSGFRFNRE